MRYVLGINDGYNATACLLKDGQVRACLSEERLRRVKNYTGFPDMAAKWLLAQEGLEAHDLDTVCLFGHRSYLGSLENTEEENMSGSPRFRLSHLARPVRAAVELLGYKSRLSRVIADSTEKAISAVGGLLSRDRRIRRVQKSIPISEDRVMTIEHHLGHAASYYGSPFVGQEALVITIDGAGDGVSSTVSVASPDGIRRIAETGGGDSLGIMYQEVTHYLGMKPHEHEYKVMGLAPYCSNYVSQKAYPVFERLLDCDGLTGLTFKSSVHSSKYYRYLRDSLEGQRFDAVAAAAQLRTEELIVRLVRQAISTTGIHRLVLAGGVFMNVKANLRVLELPEVEELFVFPSCGDESGPIGAAYEGYRRLVASEGGLWAGEPIRDLYWGQEFNDEVIEYELRRLGALEKYRVDVPEDLERHMAGVLVRGKVVARFKGRTEWGARALGNRSILAHPSDPAIVRVINDQIKNRDFWMPFAPSILEEREADYIVNPKNYNASYMTMGFESTPLARTELRAAMHPYDYTLRPQIVSQEWNESYYRLLNEFERLTGIGGILNTSFNLHGEPIVCSPGDAIHVFENSGLEYLAIGKLLLSKQRS